MNTYENLLYINNGFHSRDLLDSAVETFLRSALKIETGYTQKNLLARGPFVIGFMPHSGWIEPVAINRSIRESRENPAVWMTKVENSHDLPGIMRSYRQFYFVDRENPGPRTFDPALKVLEAGGVTGSALEGTRRGNPNDSDDLLSLSEDHPGLMYLGIKAQVPIIAAVILGSENFLPLLKEEKAKRGTLGIVTEIIRRSLFDKTNLQVRFIPPYTNHLREEGISKLSERAKFHTDRLVREYIIPEIKSLNPNYPLGFYGQSVRR